MHQLSSHGNLTDERQIMHDRVSHHYSASFDLIPPLARLHVTCLAAHTNLHTWPGMHRHSNIYAPARNVRHSAPPGAGVVASVARTLFAHLPPRPFLPKPSTPDPVTPTLVRESDYSVHHVLLSIPHRQSNMRDKNDASSDPSPKVHWS
jgi:hypothetical protein